MRHKKNLDVNLSLRGVYKENKRELGVIAVFGFYLAALPRILSLTTDCLQNPHGSSYLYEECNINQVLDQLSQYMLIGFGLAVFGYFLARRTKSVVKLVSVAVVLAGFCISTFYWYIPQLETKVVRAPIILNSLESEN